MDTSPTVHHKANPSETFWTSTQVYFVGTVPDSFYRLKMGDLVFV